MARLTCCVAVVLFVGTPALAEQYWIAYEGNELPENVGWTRITGPLGGAQRWIENGSLVIDSRESVSIVDFYRRDLNGNLDPQPGELFIAEWRVRIDEVIGRFDLDIGVFSDENWAVGLSLNENTIESVFEQGVSAPFSPGVFHRFELRSSDMRSYQLYIDDVLAFQGLFWESLTWSRVFWGDDVQGAASLSHWDYFRFGVVPEPGGLLLLSALAPWILRARLGARSV